MKRLPVMVGLGGINPAGRISFNHAYRRLVIDALPQSAQERTYRSLAQLMGLPDDNIASAALQQQIKDHTLIRRIELWDPDSVSWQSSAKLSGSCRNRCRTTGRSSHSMTARFASRSAKSSTCCCRNNANPRSQAQASYLPGSTRATCIHRAIIRAGCRSRCLARPMPFALPASALTN